MPRQMVFDYVVVGAGSAGCVMANRLSASEQNRVCLLEAGPKDRSPLIHMPAGISYLVPGDRYNLHHETEPQSELNDRRMFWPRGRTLGGSSSINAMIYVRGNSADYDAWEAAGNPGWSWRDLKPYFLKAEGNQRGSDSHHSGFGPLAVSDLRWKSEIGKAFLSAAVKNGHFPNPDFNSDKQTGVGFYQVTQRNGRRCSSAVAYLHPVMSRPNLDVMTGAQVARLLFRGDRVTGVELLNGQQILANREVVLSAGALQSPQILMLSGIGDAAMLQKHGITVQAHLPGVGQNLQDHLDITQVVEASKPVTFNTSPWSVLKTGFRLPEWFFGGRGPLTSNVAEVGGFAHSSLSGGEPDIQFHFTAAALFDHGRKKLPGYGYSLHACALRPLSRGYLTLASANPADLPRLQPNYLSASEDLQVMIEAFEMARDILDRPEMRRYQKRWWLPGEGLTEREDIIRFIREHAESIYHPVGTCKMGRDEMAVVDEQLKVRGVDGLRVVDASIMPTLVSGNTNAPAIAIAEKGADMMLNEPAPVSSKLRRETA